MCVLYLIAVLLGGALDVHGPVDYGRHREIVTEAVDQDGGALAHASAALRRDVWLKAAEDIKNS